MVPAQDVNTISGLPSPSMSATAGAAISDSRAIAGSTPPFAPIRYLHRKVLLQLPKWIGKRASSNPEAYSYLSESSAAWPAQRELGEIIAAAGWEDVEWINLTFGVVAVHRAVKPARPQAAPEAARTDQPAREPESAAPQTR